jgi:hypothetical protein
MPVCNEQDKGSRFALIRKDADLLHGIETYERQQEQGESNGFNYTNQRS